MKRILSVLFFLPILFFGCASGQHGKSFTELSATEFSNKLSSATDPVLLDVRTPEEFGQSHIKNAVNVDWNGNNFDAGIANLDKSKPVFVYCLSGGRSSAAAKHMVSLGFNEVYEMEGGLLKWRENNLPETAANASTSAGMTQTQFDSIVNSNKPVLFDFYADWCQPCQRMKPSIEEIKKEQFGKLSVVSINADDNRSLCRALGVDGLPTLKLFKDKTLAWTHTGYLDKEDVMLQIQK